MKKRDENFHKKTGNRIKNLRRWRNYSRELVAEKAEISAKFLYEIETGKKGCSYYVLYKLAEILEVPVEWFWKDAEERRGSDDQ